MLLALLFYAVLIKIVCELFHHMPRIPGNDGIRPKGSVAMGNIICWHWRDFKRKEEKCDAHHRHAPETSYPSQKFFLFFLEKIPQKTYLICVMTDISVA